MFYIDYKCRKSFLFPCTVTEIIINNLCKLSTIPRYRTRFSCGIGFFCLDLHSENYGMAQNEKITILDIARRTGLSKGTVDRVLHHRGDAVGGEAS